VVESLTSTLTRVTSYLKVSSYVVLPDVIIETTRTERDNKRLFILQRVRLRDPGRGRFNDAPPRLYFIVQLFDVP
jgi:hypothetical protein